MSSDHDYVVVAPVAMVAVSPGAVDRLQPALAPVAVADALAFNLFCTDRKSVV